MSPVLVNPSRFGPPVVGTTFDDAVLALSPLVYLKNAESSGTTMLDLSPNARSGTYTGVTLGVAGPTTDGATAVTTAGNSNSHGDVPFDAWMNGLTALSMLCWIKFTTGTAMVPWSKARSSGGTWPYGMAVDSGGHPFLAISTNTGQTSATSTTVAGDNAWHMTVGTWDGSTQKIYVDNGAAASVSKGGTLLNVNSVLQVGGRGDSAFYAGSVGRCALFNFALSSTQVGTLYAAR